MRLTATLALLIALAAPASAGADGRIIVKYRKTVPAAKRRSSIRAVGGAVVGMVRGQRTRVVAVAGDPAHAAARVARRPGVEWAEPDAKLFALAAPSDPLLGQLGGLGLMHAQVAWDALGVSESYPSDGGTPVAIVDTGIDSAHEDLAGKAAACASARDGSIVEGDCADDEGHGSHVAGTIAALANDGVVVAGVAFDSPLLICKALGGD